MNTAPPRILTCTLGPWETNCYLVAPPDSEHCWIIDVGFEPQPLIDSVRRHGLTPVRILLTHAHLDHIAGIDEVLDAFGEMPIAIHPAEAPALTDPLLNLSALIGMNVSVHPATESLEDGQSLSLDDMTWSVMHTPGHSPGGISLYHQPSRTAIVGDTLFAGSIGRYDFPNSNGRQLLDSIRTRLLTLPDDARVLPGHGPETTIGAERADNPFLNP